MIDPRSLDLLDREELLQLVTRMTEGGVFVNFHGKRSAVEIAKHVRPRVTKHIKDLFVGSPEDQRKNVLIEGENLQAMVTLYKYRGQIDLIVTDPPYNTGTQFRYNDKWDEDPNDPDLGQIVPMEDGSRHTKWMKAMMPRLHMMKSMLKPGGVIAMCIDDNELFHLGMMLDEVFGEKNRLAIINWQKTTVKNNTKKVSTTTEYVLVYSRDADFAETRLLPRSDKSNARFGNPDNDPDGKWKQGDLTGTGADSHPTALYGIQSPFTSVIHYPPENRCWAFDKRKMKEWLEAWGSTYEERDLEDGRKKALVIRRGRVPGEKGFSAEDRVLAAARKTAEKRLAAGVWPRLYFGQTGQTKPMAKVYLSEIKAGVVPTTFWVDEEEESIVLDSVSWSSTETGRTREGLEELDEIVGQGHNFMTVKPLKLIEKIIKIWSPQEGLVLDPYAGTGTTGHAILKINHETKSKRRFILIEQGRPDNGDQYARTLTYTRLRNAVTGLRPAGNGKDKKSQAALGGGFEFHRLTSQIDAKTVLSMKRDDLVDVVITSHWDANTRKAPSLIRIDDSRFQYLVGKDGDGHGYFIIWDGDGPVGRLDVTTFRKILEEGKRAGLAAPYHVYARYEVYQSPNVLFYKIPDKILAHLGLNESTDNYNAAKTAVTANSTEAVS